MINDNESRKEKNEEINNKRRTNNIYYLIIVVLLIIGMLSVIRFSNQPNSSDDITTSKSSHNNKESETDSVDNDIEYEEAMQKLNKGIAQDVSYDSTTNTVTWTGFDDWSNWEESDYDTTFDLIQTITYQQENKFNKQHVSISVVLPDGTEVASASNGDDLIYTK